MMLSKYARKKMLANVANYFKDHQIDWLNNQPEFTRACAEETDIDEIVDLGKSLLKHRRALHPDDSMVSA